MAKADIERFVADVKTNETLQIEVRDNVGVQALVEVANKHGYSVTEEDVLAYAAAHQSELSEKELEVVSGGVSLIGGKELQFVAGGAIPMVGITRKPNSIP